MSDGQKRELEEDLERGRWWPRPPGAVSASLATRGDEAPSQMRGSWAKWNRAVAHYHDLGRAAREWLRDSWSIECEFDAAVGGHVATFRTREDGLERLRIG